jgi:site-specific recombinase XerD
MSILAALTSQVSATGQGDFLAQDLTHTFLDALSTQNSRRVYAHGVKDFFAWAGAHAEGAAFGRQLVLRYRLHLQERGLATATINVQLAAIRALAREAYDRGLLSTDAAHAFSRSPACQCAGQK